MNDVACIAHIDVTYCTLILVFQFNVSVRLIVESKELSRISANIT